MHSAMANHPLLFSRLLLASVALASIAGSLGLVASCGDGGNTTGQGGAGGAGGQGGSSTASGMDASDAFSIDLDAQSGPFADFPTTPVVDPTLPTDVPDLFGVPDMPGGAGPCLTEPPIDAMFPTNWTPPLFEWNAPAGHNVFELRLHADNQTNDLVVYTDKPSFSLPKDTWELLALHSAGHAITVTVRSGALSGSMLTAGPSLGTSGDVHIAPVPAPGSIVYWTTSSGSALKGFRIGDTTVNTIVTPQLINDGTNCVGCHVSSPDGKLTFLSRRGPTNSFSVTGRKVDGTAGPANAKEISPNALTLLARTNQTLPTLSKAHYSATDAVVLTAMANADTNNRWEIVWTDLLATSGGWGVVARNGDSRNAATPSFSHDGKTVAYTSTDQVIDGRTESTPTDIYTVPYNDRQGGTATPLDGASDPNFHEYYPIFSPGDGLIAFNRAPVNVGTYNQPQAEIYLALSKGGGLTRLAGNDPSMCSGQTSPGLTNSWPRWAPESAEVGGKRYYWLVFSSTRRSANPQLYVSAVVTSTSGGAEQIEKTYPAIYVTAQPPAEANHTPAWDVFQIKPPQ